MDPADAELYRSFYDDRDLRPGVKLNDADLLGMPIRVVVSKRSLATQSLEVKERSSQKAENIPVAGSTLLMQMRIDQMEQKLYGQYPHIQDKLH